MALLFKKTNKQKTKQNKTKKQKKKIFRTFTKTYHATHILGLVLKHWFGLGKIHVTSNQTKTEYMAGPVWSMCLFFCQCVLVIVKSNV